MLLLCVSLYQWFLDDVPWTIVQYKTIRQVMNVFFFLCPVSVHSFSKTDENSMYNILRV